MTTLALMDFETYSEAGYLWDADEQRWGSLPGHSDQSRGIKAVGSRNYVEHPTFEILCLAYDLKDGHGPSLWIPGRAAPERLFAHVRAGWLIEAWNSGFEFDVWSVHCTPVLGWPVLALEQMRCAMSKSAANAYPRGLDDAGPVLGIEHLKDPAGKKLIRKLTVPKNPTKKAPGTRWYP